MRLIFTVTFLIILGNTYSLTTTTSTDPPTTGSSVSSQSLSATTGDGTTSETSEAGTTETDTTTSSSSTTSSTTSSDTMTSTYTESTTSLDSSTEISTTPSVTSSEMTTSISPTSPESTLDTSSVSPQTSSSSTISEPSETTSSSTEEPSTSSGVSTTVTETSSSATSSPSNAVTQTVTQSTRTPSSSTSSLSSNSITPTVTQSSGVSSSSTTSSSNAAPTSSMHTTSESITTNMTTEESKEETTTVEITSISSTALPQTVTTPASHQTTPVYDIKISYTQYAGNTLIPLSIKVTFQDCLKENQVIANITVEILKLDSCKSVATESDYSCGNDTRNVKFGYPVIFHVDVLASSLLEEERIKNETIENITTTIISTSAGSVHTAELASSYSSITACNTKICKDAVSDNKGFSCKNNGSNCILSSPCNNNGNCSEGGTCVVQTNGKQYTASCKCKDDDMYTYSGSQCESKTYSWKLWTIVASGVGGGIIVILLFAVVIQCARKKSESFNQKYGYDSGFDDRENLMYDRRYVTSDEYHRKPVPRDDVGPDQVNLQSFENKGYDHWEPAESKETYASMDRHFQDPTFHAQITRPKLTTNKYSGDQLTPF